MTKRSSFQIATFWGLNASYVMNQGSATDEGGRGLSMSRPTSQHTFLCTGRWLLEAHFNQTSLRQYPTQNELKNMELIKMCPIMNAWIFRGEGQAVIPCKGKTTEAFQEILQSFSNCSFFQYHYATSVCFPASLPPFISPILPPPTSSKCSEAAPLRQPEIQCRFFSPPPPPPPLSLNCPNLSGEEALPKICSLFKQPWQWQAALHESSVIYCLINTVHCRRKQTWPTLALCTTQSKCKWH